MSVICKKRKVETHLMWNGQILYEITGFIKRVKDFLHLAETCRDFYNWLINNEITLNLMFKNYQFNKLPKVIPNYLLNNLKYLIIEEISEEQLILFKKLECLAVAENLKIKNSNLEIFTKLKSLEISSIKNINFELMKENLEELNVCYIDDLKDEKINCLENLTSLNVIGCDNINGDCLQYFTKLNKLIAKTLNNITDDKVVNCYNLEYLDLSCCKNIFGKCLEKLTNLKVLNLKSNTIKYYYFEKLLQLEELNLNNVSFSDISKLKLPKSLKKLSVMNTDVNDEHLQYLEQLNYLDICATEYIYGKYFKNLKQLTYLNAKESNISGENLTFCNKLKHLNIFSCDNIEGTKLPENLEHLIIGDSDKCVITDDYFINLNKLKHLTIGPNNNVTDNIFLNLKSIKCLFLDTECNEIKGDNFKELKNLKQLQVSCNVSEENIKELTTLKYLNVSFNSNFTGQCLLNLKQLKEFTYKDEDIELDLEQEDLKELIEELKSGKSFKTLYGPKQDEEVNDDQKDEEEESNDYEEEE